MRPPTELRPGSRVAVVGGGPAGSFFALHLLEIAGRESLALEVDIYEPRDFSLPGPLGCNRCAGILSSRLLRAMNDLRLQVPDTAIQNRISSYRLLSPFGSIEIHNPEPGQDIFSIYRGGGPRHAPTAPEASLDRFLLGEALRRGARRHSLRALGIRLHPRPGLLVAAGWREYDLVALAGGANAQRVPIEGLDYRPPATLRMSQDELLARREDVEAAFGSQVKLFVLPHSAVTFGTLVPKGERINVSLLGYGGPPSISEFLEHPLVKKALPFPYQKVCGCKPLISVGMATPAYADGFVAIGDAGATHLYKDGIGAAEATARRAAHTAVYHGISKGAFGRHYRPFLASLNQDNVYGRLLFHLYGRSQKSPSVFHAYASLAQKEWATGKERRPFSEVLWGMFTGSRSYGRILRTVLQPGFLVKLLLRSIQEKMKGNHLQEPVRIVVVGGGFAGIYATLKLEKALRREPQARITLVDRENFFLFAPLLHEVASGAIETRHITLPIRGLRGRRKFRFLNAEVDAIDLENKRVHTGPETLPYDYLVLALGAEADPLPPASGSSHVFPLRTLYDGLFLRNQVIRMFEQADAHPAGQAGLLTFVVAGGGAIGVQMAAALWDLVMRSLVKHYRNVDPASIRIILAHREDHLLGDMDAKIAAYALSQLRKKGIEVRLGSPVTRASEVGVELGDGTVIATRTVVWAAGFRAAPVVAGLPVKKDATGRVMVDERFEVPGAPGVYCLGDNACFVDRASGKPLPARAHIAVREPGTVVKNILADLKGGPKRAFITPWMADPVCLGSRSAAIKVFGLRLYGFPARVIWLATFLALLPRNYNRIRVAIDWLMSLLFGRDSTLLRLR